MLKSEDADKANVDLEIHFTGLSGFRFISLAGSVHLQTAARQRWRCTFKDQLGKPLFGHFSRLEDDGDQDKI